MDKKVLLMILDGWGEGKHDRSNAIYTQGTPNLDKLRAQYPVSFLKACGEDVGLPAGSGRALHFFGLCSHGGVHSSLAHLYEFLEVAAQYKLPKVYVHCFMDGRDCDPRSGKGFIEELQAKCAELRAKYPDPSQGPVIASPRPLAGSRHRQHHRTLLRHGPRQEVGPRQDGLRLSRKR